MTGENESFTETSLSTDLTPSTPLTPGNPNSSHGQQPASLSLSSVQRNTASRRLPLPSSRTVIWLLLFGTGSTVLLNALRKEISAMYKEFKKRLRLKAQNNQRALHQLLSKVPLLVTMLDKGSEIWTLPNQIKSYVEIQNNFKDPYFETNSRYLNDTLDVADSITRLITSETYLPFSSSSPDAFSKKLLDIKKELRSLKGLLLSSRNFPSVT